MSKTDAEPHKNLASTLLALADRRLWVIFTLGMASGYPWVLTGSAMSLWLKELGWSRSAIGFFTLVGFVYAINFLWAPLVDRLRLPLLQALGQRRSWILLTQTIMLLATIAISQADPNLGLLYLTICAVTITFSSATQDVAIDAYRIDRIGQHETTAIAHGSAMATIGWWTGFGLPGALAFYLADPENLLGQFNWHDIYWVLAILWLPMMGFVLAMAEPQHDDNIIRAATARYQKATGNLDTLGARLHTWLLIAAWEPLKEFFSRNGVKIALAIFSFVLLFKLGEAFLGKMAIVFYKELGFSNTSIAGYSKLLNWFCTVIFSLFASVFAARIGLIKGLFIGGIAMATSNLMFAWLAVVGPDKTLFAAAIIVDSFTSAVATVMFVAFISHLTNQNFTATQYALLASLGNLGKTTLSATSGAFIDWLKGDWPLFFVITALMVIPSLLLLLWLAKELRARNPDMHL